jgi:hypothetical protein
MNTPPQLRLIIQKQQNSTQPPIKMKNNIMQIFEALETVHRQFTAFFNRIFLLKQERGHFKGHTAPFADHNFVFQLSSEVGYRKAKLFSSCQNPETNLKFFFKLHN